MNLLTYNALLYATEVIIPVGMDGMAIVGARQTLAGIHEIRDLWPARPLNLLAVLPTSVNTATNATRAAFEALDADPEMRDRLYRRGIRQCIDVTYALTQETNNLGVPPRGAARRRTSTRSSGSSGTAAPAPSAPASSVVPGVTASRKSRPTFAVAQDPLDARPGWVYRSDAPVPVPAAAPEAPSPTAERFEPGRATPAAPRDWVASGF